MSEVLWSGNVHMPSGYEKLDGIEIMRQKDGATKVNGLIELGDDEKSINRKVQSLDPLEMWGYESDEYEHYISNPDKWDMKWQMQRLTERIDDLEERNRLLEEREIAREAELTALQNQLADTNAETLNDQELEVNTENVPIHTLEPEPEVVEEEVIDIDPEENVTGSPVVDPSVEASPMSEHRSRIGRITGSIGGWLLGRQVRLHNGAYNLVDRRGNVTVVEEETAANYAETNERAGVAAVGGLAVGAVVGIALWEFFEHKVFGHSSGSSAKVINHYDTVTVPPSGSGAHSVNAFDIPGANSSGRHVDYYNSDLNHRKTGIEMPKKVHLDGAPGSQRIVDSSGNVVVPHNKLSWDRQGNLSSSTRSYIRGKNYLLTQANLGKRYMTEIWQK
jgi:hypothetical protein